MKSVTPKQTAILDYLQNKGWIGPTEIGIKVGLKSYASASAWASPKLEILLKSGLIIKNTKGQVCLKEAPNQDNK